MSLLEWSQWMIGPDFNGNAGGLLHPQYGLMDVPKTGWQYAGDEGWIQDDSITVLAPRKTQTKETSDPIIEMTDTILASPEEDSDGELQKTESFSINYQCGIKNMKPTPLIYKGEETEKNEWPWMASILNVTLFSYMCGATLISDSYLITAAHCVDDGDEESYVIRLGDHDLSLEGETRDKAYTIENITIHKDYDEDEYEDDIALIKLTEKVMFTNIWPICLPEPGRINLQRNNGPDNEANMAFVTGEIQYIVF